MPKKPRRRIHSVRVKKRHVNPFDGARQAEEIAKHRADVPMGTNTRELEFEGADRGEHYEVEIRESPGEGSGPPSGRPARGSGGPGFGGGVGLGLGEAHGRSPNHAGRPDDPGEGYVPELSLTRPSQARTVDLEGRLLQNSIAELRRMAKRHGVNLRRHDSTGRIARRIVSQRPGAARREAGLR